jgi:hypothetical protein
VRAWGGDEGLKGIVSCAATECVIASRIGGSQISQNLDPFSLTGI